MSGNSGEPGVEAVRSSESGAEIDRLRSRYIELVQLALTHMLYRPFDIRWDESPEPDDYAGSDHIDQSGSLTDVRVGLTKEWEPGHVFELLALRNVTDMRHDVHFTTWTWDPVARTSASSERAEVNLDQTNIWGALVAILIVVALFLVGRTLRRRSIG